MLPENSRNRQSGDKSLPNKLSANTRAFAVVSRGVRSWGPKAVARRGVVGTSLRSSLPVSENSSSKTV